MKNLCKRIAVITLAVVASLVTVACQAKPETPTTVVVEAFPVTIIDQAGREVTIEEVPEKIVSGYYIASSALIALGLQDKMVGIEDKAQTRNIYTLAETDFLTLPSVGTMKEFKLEDCIALSPELVILPLTHKDAANTLQDMGINAICVAPENQELLEEALIILGEATGTLERATELQIYIDNKTEELQELLQDAPKKTVYISSNSDLLSTVGSKMYQNTLIENANATNVASEIEDTYWANISYEQLLAYNPEYMILTPLSGFSVEDILNDSNITQVVAVENKNVYQMPSDFESWDSPIPSAFLGSIWIASVTNPEICSEEYFKNSVVEFYEMFYGFTPQV